MHVLQTAGLPPSTGSSIFPASGCTMKSSVAEKKIASAKSRRPVSTRRSYNARKMGDFA